MKNVIILALVDDVLYCYAFLNTYVILLKWSFDTFLKIMEKYKDGMKNEICV